MNLKTRRILYLFFILAFFIITPLVSIYATGYKLSFSKHLLQKTGMLIIDSNPRGAKIFLNNKPLKKHNLSFFTPKKNEFFTSPNKIKNLLPGEYNVRVELNGYWPWEKKLSIYPGNSTFAEDIFLFKKSSPTIVQNASSNNMFLSPNKAFALITDASSSGIFNFNSEKFYKLTIKEQALVSKNKAWSKNNSKILIDNIVFDSKDGSKTSIHSKLPKNADRYILDSDNIYYSKNNSIFSLDLENGTIKKLLSANNISDFNVYNKNLYLLASENHETYLKIFNPSQNIFITNVKLPYSKGYSFTNPNSDVVNIFDNNYSNLFLIDTANPFSPILDIIPNFKNGEWVDGSKLIFTNGFELWYYDIDNNKKNLLARFGKKINEVKWHPSNNYIIFSTDDGVYTLELDNRDKHSITKILNLGAINSLNVKSNGENLYFNTKIGNQEGIFKLKL